MAAALIDTLFEVTNASANVVEKDTCSLFRLEHELNILFSELQKKYKNIFFKLERSGHPSDLSLSQDELSGIFKIVSEAVENSLTHSNPSTIKAEVKLINHDLIQFSISDNGTGFDLDSVPETNRHPGIKRICDYANQINGRVVFDSNPERGTQVVVAKPVEKQRARFYTRLVALF